MPEQNSSLFSRHRVINAALGKALFDTLLINVNIIDVSTGEIRLADIGIVDDLIASIHPIGNFTHALQIVDLDGAFASPGLIDTHVHIESSHLTPAEYANVVIPQGTTTVLWDPHELANILGLAGVQQAINACKELPLRVLIAAPSCVPSTLRLESSAAEFNGKEMAEMLSWPEVAAVAEIMDMNGLLTGSNRMSEILDAGLSRGKLIEGHARGLTDEQLQAYIAAGVSSDHELTSAEDLLAKLRAGLTIQIRVSHPYLLPEFVQVINGLPHLSPLITLCTDDVPPDLLFEKGGLLQLIHLLVEYGLKPIDVLRMATLNAAQRLQRNDLGLIAPGRVADIVIFNNLTDLIPIAVYSKGKLVAENNKMLSPLLTNATPAITAKNTMLLPPTQYDDFRVKVPGIKTGKAKLRIIKSARFTQWSEVTVDVINGFAQLPDGYSLIFVQHRHGTHQAKPQLSIMEDWGTFNGAIGTTYSHDSHNLVVLGNNPDDMRLAANELIRQGGGMILTQNNKILNFIAMPIAGIISDVPIQILASDFKKFREMSGRVAQWNPPYRVFKAIEGTCLACNKGPHLTDLGLTDGETQQIINPIIDAWEI